MITVEHQHQCSSKAITHNTSITYKFQGTYLIIDIEPTVNQADLSNDRSYYSRVKDYLPYGPNEDSSITNILVGIGIVAVALGLLVALIKLIRICYKMWQAEDDEENKTDQMKNAPLLPLSGSKVVRRNSSIRNPNAPIHRSSLNIETQMEIRQKRLSQTYSNTPPAVKKP
ncbi:unnamed protein product [Adineta ricciae]|uniref:Uncharacterized protein n=1 Tax=Adineta ricciae TaxID=249248 RepID=A0A814QA44_ADIRI|nr:unnamed protein product [Adineta ricciae]